MNHQDRVARPRVAILTNVLPSYRQGFYDRLFARPDLEATVYCQRAIPGLNVRSIHDRYPGRVRLVRGVSGRGESLGWQFTPLWRVLFGYDVVFVDGNPRALSRALTATLLRLLRRRVVLWTTGHSYGANPLTEAARLRWTRMFDRLFVYTAADADYLRARGFGRQDIIAMNNGLDQSGIDAAIAAWPATRLTDWQSQHNLLDRTVLLSCARIDPKNQFERVIGALPAILSRVPNVVWCLIGTGPDEQRLATLARDAGLSDRVRFVGEVYEQPELAPWFLSATVFVHPAAIGLSLLHAFGYGLPVVTSDQLAQHGPEIAAFEDGQTGRMFRDSDPEGLAHAVSDLLQDPQARARIRARVQHLARTEYNVDVMVERFMLAIEHALGRRSEAPLVSR